MFGNFVWWEGVVEDRIDPLKLGRCRVRILGYHTNNKASGTGIPTEDLPWATPMQPITSAAMNGVGTTPLGPVEGTWVFGFFRDGKDAQDPVMLGTVGGIPQEPADPQLGFNDPYGRYPLQTHIGEQDTNRLARGGGAIPVPLKTESGTTSEDSPSLNFKRKSRNKGIPTALAGDMTTSIANTDNSALYEFTPWNEPNPRYGGVADSDTEYLDTTGLSSVYPFNHVRMSESGHVEEWDDTPTVERLHRFHKSGTFEEIQPDGTKVVKVVANDYEIVLGYKDVMIKGTCNVTIEGDCRMLYQADLVQEVYGDYHLNVHGEMRTKVGGNQTTEVFGDRKTTINVNDDLKVGNANQECQQIINIDGNRTTNVSGFVDETIQGNLQEMIFGTMGTIVAENTSFITVKDMNVAALGKLGLSTDSNCDITVTGNTVFKTTGSYSQQNTGATRLQYKSTLDERQEGHYKLFVGDDTSTVRTSGKVDHSCPTTRTGTNSCNTAEVVG